ncbi:MAG: hypothetical protein PVH61_40325 [Candidatus Aminicenantes bacterium]|jgi:hypothetical protein
MSYNLLQWIQGAIRKNVISTKMSHQYMSESDATREWIEEHYLNIPKNARPEKADLGLTQVFDFWFLVPGKILAIFFPTTVNRVQQPAA